MACTSPMLQRAVQRGADISRARSVGLTGAILLVASLSLAFALVQSAPHGSARGFRRSGSPLARASVEGQRSQRSGSAVGPRVHQFRGTGKAQAAASNHPMEVADSAGVC